MTPQQNKPIEPVKTSEGSLHAKAEGEARESFAPCPFCDNQNNMRIDDCDEAGNYPVRCFECFSTGPAYGEKARAVKAWNTRPRDAEVLALLEGLEEAKEVLEQCQDYAVIYNNAVPATLCKEALKTISALLSTEAQQ